MIDDSTDLPSRMHELIIRKEVDKSLLSEGLSLPLAVVDQIRPWFGNVERNAPITITLVLDDVPYAVKFQNLAFDTQKYSDRKDIWQVRYTDKNPFVHEIAERFALSRDYIRTVRELKGGGGKTFVKVPVEYKEFLCLYRTDDPRVWKASCETVRDTFAQRRRRMFEVWYKRIVAPNEMSKHLASLAYTAIQLDYYRENPTPIQRENAQNIVEEVATTQNVDRSVYPNSTAYEYSLPHEVKPMLEDCVRQRFADDGSLHSALGYYALWLRLRRPYRWVKEPLWSGDESRIKRMLEQGYDYLREYERVMEMVKSRQQIRYGAPGTGKSYGLDGLTEGETVIRTTFHPDSDYSTFVGSYKPTMVAGQIVYRFVPQAFMKAYVQAWRKQAEGVPVFLVIEEINRGNCAQIFGDLFQLLDRKDDGFSCYSIDADKDIECFLANDEDGFKNDQANIANSEVRSGRKLILPDNLYIWATMNTSDQSLFPIDSAFKRRWDWKYVPIAKPDTTGKSDWKERKIVADGKKYDWWNFITIINAQISDLTKSEDKQLGYFFVKASDTTGKITAERFANKVLFYLFNDVFKDWDLPAAIFSKGTGKDKYAFKDFFYAETTTVGATKLMPGDVKEEVIAEFLEHLKLQPDQQQSS